MNDLKFLERFLRREKITPVGLHSIRLLFFVILPLKEQKVHGQFSLLFLSNDDRILYV